MTWPVHALFSLTELTRYVPSIASEPSAEPLLTDIAGAVADDIESYLERRIVYRAPTEDDDAIYSGTYTNGTPAPTGQPSGIGRTLVVAFPSTATAGTLTVTGTVAGVAGTVRTFNVTDGLTQHGLDFWSAISGLSIASAAGGGTIKVGTSEGYIEYHSPSGSEPDLFPMEMPIYQIAAVYEDSTRAYTTALASTSYLASGRRRLTRLSSSLISTWMAGYRAVKLVHSAGYLAGSVPDKIKRAALRLAALYYRESVKGEIEVASGSNALGVWSRLGSATLSKELQWDIESERRFAPRTGERDFDERAA